MSYVKSTKPMITVERFNKRWMDGRVAYKRKTYKFQVMTFFEKSAHGINKGCISRLWIKGPNNEQVNFDRGWDIKPKSEDMKAVYHALLLKFNRKMPKEYVEPYMAANGMKAKDLGAETCAKYGLDYESKGKSKTAPKTASKTASKTAPKKKRNYRGAIREAVVEIGTGLLSNL